MPQCRHHRLLRHRLRRRHVDRPIEARLFNQELDRSNEVAFVNPRDILRSSSDGATHFSSARSVSLELGASQALAISMLRRQCLEQQTGGETRLADPSAAHKDDVLHLRVEVELGQGPKSAVGRRPSAV